MHRTVGDWLAAAARIAFLALIVFAAAAYGLTRYGPLDWFNNAAFGVFACWLIGHFVAFRLPRTGFLPWLLVGAILLFGWGVTALGYADNWLMEADEEFPEIYYEIAGWGTFAVRNSVAAMVRTSALLAQFLMAIEMFANRRWGRLLLATLAATGIGMVVFFYLQRTFGGPFLLRDLTGRIFLNFATYRYWGNGASFLGLLWPLPAAIAVYAGVRKAFGWSAWMAAALLMFGALYLNKSKAGHVLGIVGLILFAGLTITTLWRSGVFRRRQIRLSVVLVIALPLLAIALALYLAVPQKRWERLADQGLDRNVRFVAYEHFLDMIPIAGWTGYGPGTFIEVHREFIEEDPVVRKVPFWVAHQDYLQTVIEWGYAGTILWGLLLAPAGVRLLLRSLRRSQNDYRSSPTYAFGWEDRVAAFAETVPHPRAPLVQAAAFTAVTLTAIHAAVDFPMQIASLQFYFLIWIALGWVPGRHWKRENTED